jgi:hypothetical protein
VTVAGPILATKVSTEYYCYGNKCLHEMLAHRGGTRESLAISNPSRLDERIVRKYSHFVGLKVNNIGVAHRIILAKSSQLEITIWKTCICNPCCLQFTSITNLITEVNNKKTKTVYRGCI